MRIEADVIRTVVGLAVIALVVASLTWMPGLFEREGLNRRIVEAQARIADGERAAQQLEALRSTVDSLQSRYERDARDIPAAPGFSELIRQLRTTLRDRDVKDLRSRYLEELHGAEYDIAPLEFHYRGSFADAFAFLEEVESMRRLLRVEYLEISGEPGVEPDRLDVSVRLSAFHAPRELTSVVGGAEGTVRP